MRFRLFPLSLLLCRCCLGFFLVRGFYPLGFISFRTVRIAFLGLLFFFFILFVLVLAYFEKRLGVSLGLRVGLAFGARVGDRIRVVRAFLQGLIWFIASASYGHIDRRRLFWHRIPRLVRSVVRRCALKPPVDVRLLRVL